MKFLCLNAPFSTILKTPNWETAYLENEMHILETPTLEIISEYLS